MSPAWNAIPKSKGVEFASLLHQAAVTLNLNPKDKTGRAVLESVAKGSSVQLDEWLKSKAAAKKRLLRRRADEKAAKERELEEAPIDAEPPKTKPDKKAPPKKTPSTNRKLNKRKPR